MRVEFDLLRRRCFQALCVLAALRLWTPLTFVPPKFEAAIPVLLDMTGLGGRSFMDLEGIILLMFAFFSLVAFPYALIRGKNDLGALEADDRSAGGKIYLSLLDILVWEVYIFTIALVGAMVSPFTWLALSGKFPLAGVYAILLVFSISQATGLGVPRRRARAPVAIKIRPADPSQDTLGRYV
jgi:hypothetical protein